MQLSANGLSIFISLAMLAGCGRQPQENTPESAAPPASSAEIAEPALVVRATEPASDCAGDQVSTYICGIQDAEDLLSLGQTRMILGSGMSTATPPAHMSLIYPATSEFTDLIHSPNFSQ